MKYLFFLTFLFISLAAQFNPDEYLKELENATGNERVDILNNISEGYRNFSNTSEAIEYAERALAESIQKEYIIGQINSLNNLASTYLIAQQTESGIEYTRRALTLSTQNDYKSGIAASYRNIGVYFIFTNQPQLAVDTLLISVEMYRELKDTLREASAVMSLAAAYSRTNEIEKSIKMFEESADIFISKKNFYQAAHAYLNLGTLYGIIINDYKKALTYSLLALDNFTDVGDETKSAYAMISIGNTYEKLGDYEKPINYYSDALAIFEKTGNAYLIANALNNLGEVYKQRREFDKAVNFYSQSLTKSKEIKSEEGIAVTLNNIGECYFELGNNNLALDYYNQSFAILQSLNDKHKMSTSLNNQAAVYIKLNNHTKAITASEKGIELAHEIKSPEEVKRGYENIYLANKALGDYKSALESFQKFETLKDSLVNEKRSDEIATTLAEYEASKHEKEIELLTKNTELKQAELERQENLTYFFIIFSVMFLVFGVVYYYRYRERKQMNKELVEAAVKLNEINKTKDLFFSIIAHDLRGPFNSLLGLTEILAEDNKELSHEEITNLSREVNQNARNVFLLLENLLEWSSSQLGKIGFNPQALDLNETVTQNINLYRKAASVKEINLTVNPGKNVIAYGDKNMIGTITRNLINNAIKFTNRGGNVKIETETKNNSVIFSVQDNGIGMTKREIDKIFKLDSDVKKKGTENEKGTGLGLILCKDFVNKNNGTISVNSEPGKGTIFTVTLPIQS